VTVSLAVALAIPWVFWGSLILHLFFLVFFGGSYAAFVLRERKNGK